MPNTPREQTHQDAQMGEDTKAHERLGLRIDDADETLLDLTAAGEIQVHEAKAFD